MESSGQEQNRDETVCLKVPTRPRERQSVCGMLRAGGFIMYSIRGKIMMTTRRRDTVRALSHVEQVGVWDAASWPERDFKLKFVFIKRSFR